MSLANSSKTNKQQRKTKAKKAPKFKVNGWLSTDADEYQRRRHRAETEAMKVKRLQPQEAYFADYEVSSSSGKIYLIEIRSLSDHLNTCNCQDFLTNKLGTCKHIEKVLLTLQKRAKRRYAAAREQGSPFIEIFIDLSSVPKIRIQCPQRTTHLKAYKQLSSYFSSEGELLNLNDRSILALREVYNSSSKSMRNCIRLSHHLELILDQFSPHHNKAVKINHFLEDVRQGKRSINVVKHPLFPYQQEGMLHLAFSERALLADEMGLGKTVQAIAACELLRTQKQISCVLVVATASLKTEWEGQIKTFTNATSLLIQGPRHKRLLQYQKMADYHIMNYEQVMHDAEVINTLLQPDIVILDEAQRIKNWQTKTAKTIKKLQSRFAFVLTGTPLENRIDDIYSIVQFLDPYLFGPLFRFNREFYQLDDRGKPEGYKNLDVLHAKLKPILLRRTKAEVEDQLPKRTDHHYYVSMHEEQQVRYDEYQAIVAKLANKAKKRPLMPEEFKRLQMALACMRMLCDTTYILDGNSRISPKLEELEKLLTDLLENEHNKIIIFSEWERMLKLVRELAQFLGVGAAWHTGSVPQQKRREEINRFKKDPHCRIFLSTDSGSVGLNLQIANVVINLDLPWNPAKLEQRIARAWRKNQTRPVDVINIVAENTIEHNMVGLLQQKKNLFTGVIGGDENFKSMEMPSGRKAFLDRVNQILGGQAKPTQQTMTKSEKFEDDCIANFSDRLDLFAKSQNEHYFIVLDEKNNTIENQLQRKFEQHSVKHSGKLNIIDRTTLQLIEQLEENGIIKINYGRLDLLHRNSIANQHEKSIQYKRYQNAKTFLEKAERKLKMATLLGSEDFLLESLTPLKESLNFSITALLCWQDQAFKPGDEVTTQQISSSCKKAQLPEHVPNLLLTIRDADECTDTKEIQGWLSVVKQAVKHIKEVIPEPAVPGGNLLGTAF